MSAESETIGRRSYPPVNTVSAAIGFKNQARIILALTIREISERYGTEGLGYFWVFGEPMLLCFGVMLMWSIVGNNHGGAVGIPMFALTGYSHVQLFRHCIFGASLSLSRSVWITYHSSVHPLDVIIAKALMGSLGIFGGFVIGYIILYIFSAVEGPHDPLLIILAWLIDTLFCFSFSVVIAGVSETSDMVERLIHPIMYLTIPLTGVFALTAWLPVTAQKILVWSPLVNAVEMMRAGVFGDDVRTMWDPTYVVLCSVLCLAVGLPLIEFARKRIVVR